MKDAGPTVVMRLEHRKIGAALEALHAKVRDANPDSDAEEAALLSALNEHNMKEENILYPAIDKLVTPNEAAALFAQMEDIPEERFQNCCG